MSTPVKQGTAPPSPPGMHYASAVTPVHIEHFYSWAPLLLGLGALFLLIGLEFVTWMGIPVFPILGIVFLGAGFFTWIKEDVGFWNAGYTDPGVIPGKHPLSWWGLVFFLGTEVMLFGGLFAVFFVGNASFPAVWDAGAKELPLGLTALNTAILVASSFTLHFGEAQLKRNNRKGFVTWLLVTIALGAVFLGFQANEYRELIHHGNVISASAFWSIFYQLTGTHGAHVTLGLALLLIVLVRALKGQFTADRHEAVTAFSLYWHFVDVVWVFLFLVVYLLPAYGVI